MWNQHNRPFCHRQKKGLNQDPRNLDRAQHTNRARLKKCRSSCSITTTNLSPPGTHLQPQVINGNAGVAPQDTTHQPTPQPHHQQPSQPATGTSTPTPLIATGDWTKDLVHLAKTAELKYVPRFGLGCHERGVSRNFRDAVFAGRGPILITEGMKHALTLQLHTAHILSAHASLQEKSKVIQDIREQRNKLESERTRLLNALREINEDRDRADLMESTIDRECHEIRTKMNQLTEGEYAVAKNDVDRLRQELGQPPLPSLQSTLDEKANQYLNERRLGGNDAQNTASAGVKRGSGEVASLEAQPAGKRPRGRPKGSKNRNKESATSAGPSSGVM
ncbi:hypothetical protein D9615_010394 [Tricholomella constricta]|uniref:Uncharacterized protein n=1 Tax=Tricholomella constricta TaxID=117010 RepID=A0A8H5GQ22_9AGAR|nr:hypothetical protein D9615_010394 [Tricholomella constricta]